MFEFPSVHNKSLRVCVFFGVQVSCISFLSIFFLFPERLGAFVPTWALPFSNVRLYQYLALEHRVHEKFG